MSGPQKIQTPATREPCPCGERKPARHYVCKACFHTAPTWIHDALNQALRLHHQTDPLIIDALIEHAKARATP